MSRYIADTTTRTGLMVTVELKRDSNELCERVTDDELQRLKLTPHRACPQWNYTLQPHTGNACGCQSGK